MTKFAIIGGGVAGARVTSLGTYDPDDAEGFHIERHAEPERGLYRKFVLDEGLVVGAILINDPQRAAIMRPLVERQIDVPEYARRLTQDDFDVKSLL